MKGKIFAVLTGDIVDSTSLDKAGRKRLKEVLTEAFEQFPSKIKGYSSNYTLFRGDSFQLLLDEPARALKAALLIRVAIKMQNLPAKDARIAIGIGEIANLMTSLNDADGDALRNSGRGLDHIPRERRLIMAKDDDNDWRHINTSFYLLDEIMERWTASVAEAWYHTIRGKNQYEIAEELGITQPSVNNRLKIGSLDAVKNLLQYFNDFISQQP